MSQEGIFPDCPPKPLSQHRGGMSSRWMDTAVLIPITGGPDTICITSSSGGQGNQLGTGLTAAQAPCS